MKPNYTAAMFLQLNNTCNLNCEYCISNNIEKIQKKIDLEKFEKFINSLDRKFLFIYEGDGEPTLQPQILELSKIITKKEHFIAITSNMTNDVVARIAEEIESKQIAYVLASAHIYELEKRKLIDKYFRNCLLFKNKGVSVSCVEVAHPRFINEISRLKLLFKNKGLELKFDHFRGVYKGKKYPESYSDEELQAFGLGKVAEKFNVRFKYCNAGYNIFSAELVTGNGDIFKCRTIRQKAGNVWKGKLKYDKYPKVCIRKTCCNPYTLCNDTLYRNMVDKINESNKKMGGKKLDKIRAVLNELRLEPGRVARIARIEMKMKLRKKTQKLNHKIKIVVGRGLRKISPKIYTLTKKVENKMMKKQKSKE